MANFTQAGRFMKVETSLGADVLLLDRFGGVEAISEPFHFQLDMLAERPVSFAKVLGEPITVTFTPRTGPQRYFNGILSEVSQGGTVRGPDGKETFIQYEGILVPKFWLLTRRVQSRIWQHISVPDILQQLLVKEWQLDMSLRLQRPYSERNRCVQYNESDAAFARRIMEEEGIHFYFEHAEDKHTLVASDVTPTAPDLVGGNRLTFDPSEGGLIDRPRISVWKKRQRVCSGKVTLWDHSFELPGQHLEAAHLLPDDAVAGTVKHALPIAQAERLEIFQYPGRYVQYHDGIGKEGGEQPAELQKVFQTNRRLAEVALQREQAQGLQIEGRSAYWHLVPGHAFTLERHFDGDGVYQLTRVEHDVSLEGAYTTDAEVEPVYSNRFTCVPKGFPVAPDQPTPRPRVHGTQTAVVVGPAGQEIFCDKYGRVKVQFPWDRYGQNNADSSCWIRVSQAWAGKRYGMIVVPRIGQEVIVDFLDGDPDRPIVVGAVYNADQMPPFELPANANLTALKSHSVNGKSNNFSGLALHDQLGEEQVQLYSERDLTINAENNKVIQIGADHQLSVGGSQTHSVGQTYRLSVNAPSGSGSGGGAPWDYISDGGSAPPHVQGQAGGYFQDVWGAMDLTVIGAYGCTVLGNQTYFTALGTYQNIVLAALNLNLTAVGGMFNFMLGTGVVNVTLGPTVNYTSGPVYNLHETGLTKVGLAPISLTTTAAINVAAGGLIDMDAAAIEIEAVGDAIFAGMGTAEVMGGTGGLNLGSAANTIVAATTILTLSCGVATIAMTSEGVITITGTSVVINGRLTVNP